MWSSWWTQWRCLLLITKLLANLFTCKNSSFFVVKILFFCGPSHTDNRETIYRCIGQVSTYTNKSFNILVEYITFIIFWIQNLTWSLVLKLIIFTKICWTIRAHEYTTTMIPRSTFTFSTICILKGTNTSMSCKAFSTMTHPRFTKITNSTLNVEFIIIIKIIVFIVLIYYITHTTSPIPVV